MLDRLKIIGIRFLKAITMLLTFLLAIPLGILDGIYWIVTGKQGLMFTLFDWIFSND
jgi:hypothetical protein